MRVKVKGNPIVSTIGSLSDGVIYTLPDHIATHLIEIGSAVSLENKVIVDNNTGEQLSTKIEGGAVEVSQKKSAVSASLSSQAAQASPQQTSKKRETLTLSQSTRTTK